MKYLQLLTLALFLFSSSSFSQMDVSVKRKEFKAEKTGFNAAWKNIRKGDSFYKDGGVWYLNALNEYERAYVYNSTNAELNYKIGVSSLFSDKKDEAAGYFIKAYDLKNDVARDILFLTGRALMYSGKHGEAIDKLNSYLLLAEKKPQRNIDIARKCIEESTSALAVTKDTLRVDILNIGGNINSSADDYSEVFTSDGLKMFFGSRRALTEKEKRYYKDTKLNENIFSADYVSDAWGVAMLADKNLTTDLCETPLYVNNTGNLLYLYAGYEGDGDIMVSELKKGKWKKPEQVNFKTNTKYPETSFTISGKGDEIAFVSNRGKKGEGGKDIYLMKQIKKRKWSNPVNLGPTVNTHQDEESVRFSVGGDTLWFSSRGHNSIGGFDIFYTTRSSSGEWNKPVNAGFPLNTSWDELFYNPSPVNDSSFFFVSNRSNGFGGLDIYKGRYLPPLPPPVPVVVPDTVKAPVVTPVPVTLPKADTVVIRDTVVVIKEIVQAAPPVSLPVLQQETPKELILYLIGKITDAETKEPVLARIEVIDLSTDQVLTTTASSDIDGTYRVRLPAKKSYMVNLRASGFLADMKSVAIPETYTQEFYTLDVPLTKVKIGKKIVLNNILFELGKAVLTTGSYGELDKLVDLLKDNPQMKIEISGHTDNTGSPVVNAKLSTDRAKAVVDYLVQKGIDRGRLSYMGYGSDQPIADNATAAGKAKNRRVEFKILGL
jgi:outer membrane protein OmpA-like peptidoglycan-associated protein